MKKAWRLIARVIFWSYERGSLPYDLMVIAILLFVLLTPRTWYHDQPNVGAHAVSGQIRLLDVETDSQTEVFRVDAALLPAPRRIPELEQQTHSLLSQRVASLHGVAFQVVQIQPVRDPSGVVVGYDVRIKPRNPSP